MFKLRANVPALVFKETVGYGMDGTVGLILMANSCLKESDSAMHI